MEREEKGVESACNIIKNKEMCVLLQKSLALGLRFY